MRGRAARGGRAPPPPTPSSPRRLSCGRPTPFFSEGGVPAGFPPPPAPPFLSPWGVILGVAYPLFRRKGGSLTAHGEEEPEDLRLRREKLYEAIRELDLERDAGSGGAG